MCKVEVMFYWSVPGLPPAVSIIVFMSFGSCCVACCTKKKKNEKSQSFLGGLEPPIFRLTAERADRLRHRNIHLVTDIEITGYYE